MDNPLARNFQQEAVRLATDLATARRELAATREALSVMKAWADDYKAQRDRLQEAVERVRELRDRMMDAEEAPESSVWVLNMVLVQFGEDE